MLLSIQPFKLELKWHPCYPSFSPLIGHSFEKYSILTSVKLPSLPLYYTFAALHFLICKIPFVTWHNDHALPSPPSLSTTHWVSSSSSCTFIFWFAFYFTKVCILNFWSVCCSTLRSCVVNDISSPKYLWLWLLTVCHDHFKGYTHSLF